MFLVTSRYTAVSTRPFIPCRSISSGKKPLSLLPEAHKFFPTTPTSPSKPLNITPAKAPIPKHLFTASVTLQERFLLEKALKEARKPQHLHTPLARLSQEPRFTPTYPEHDLDSLMGYDEVKASFVDIINYLQDPTKYLKSGLTPPKGLILSGPPGVGKTFFGEVIAGHAGVPLIYVSAPELMDKYVGNGELMLRELFRKAQEQSPCLLFIDEVDTLASSRLRPSDSLEGFRNSIVNQLNTLLSKDHPEVVVIVATNFPENLDEAFKRPGRFDNHIRIGLPSKDDRCDILKKAIHDKRILCRASLDDLAAISVGFSPAKIIRWMDEAQKLAHRANIKYLTQNIFDEARSIVELGHITPRKLSKEELLSIASHEAGHALVAHLLKVGEIYKMSALPQGRFSGYTEIIYPEENGNYSLKEYLNYICVCLAGRAAEYIIQKPMIGAEDDFNKAKNLVHQLIEKEAYGQSFFGGIRDVEKILEEQMFRASGIILANMPLFIALGNALMTHKQLDKSDIATLLANQKLDKPLPTESEKKNKVAYPPSKQLTQSAVKAIKVKESESFVEVFQNKEKVARALGVKPDDIIELRISENEDYDIVFRKSFLPANVQSISYRLDLALIYNQTYVVEKFIRIHPRSKENFQSFIETPKK